MSNEEAKKALKAKLEAAGPTVVVMVMRSKTPMMKTSPKANLSISSAKKHSSPLARSTKGACATNVPVNPHPASSFNRTRDSLDSALATPSPRHVQQPRTRSSSLDPKSRKPLPKIMEDMIYEGNASMSQTPVRRSSLSQQDLVKMFNDPAMDKPAAADTLLTYHTPASRDPETMFQLLFGLHRQFLDVLREFSNEKLRSQLEDLLKSELDSVQQGRIISPSQPSQNARHDKGIVINTPTNAASYDEEGVLPRFEETPTAGNGNLYGGMTSTPIGRGIQTGLCFDTPPEMDMSEFLSESFYQKFFALFDNETSKLKKPSFDWSKFAPSSAHIVQSKSIERAENVSTASTVTIPIPATPTQRISRSSQNQATPSSPIVPVVFEPRGGRCKITDVGVKHYVDLGYGSGTLGVGIQGRVTSGCDNGIFVSHIPSNAPESAKSLHVDDQIVEVSDNYYDDAPYKLSLLIPDQRAERAWTT